MRGRGGGGRSAGEGGTEEGGRGEERIDETRGEGRNRDGVCKNPK